MGTPVIEKYRTIVADPPWQHPGTGSPRAGWRNAWATEREAPLNYPSMTIGAIAGLPVETLPAADCRVFLWATNTVLPDAYIVLRAWGFQYRQTLVWRKPDANPIGGSVAPNAEFLLVGVRGRPPVLRRLPNAVMEHPRGGLRHSEKPEMWLDLIEQASPPPRIELFARRQRLGWDTWGDEALGHVTMASGD